MLGVSQVCAAAPEFTLRYDKPAAMWTEALPIGNGRIGAMVFGGTSEERLQINEATLWGGGPHDYTNPGAASHLEEIRHLIFAGKSAEAAALAERVMGRPKLLMPYLEIAVRVSSSIRAWRQTGGCAELALQRRFPSGESRD